MPLTETDQYVIHILKAEKSELEQKSTALKAQFECCENKIVALTRRIRSLESAYIQLWERKKE